MSPTERLARNLALAAFLFALLACAIAFPQIPDRVRQVGNEIEPPTAVR